MSTLEVPFTKRLQEVFTGHELTSKSFNDVVLGPEADASRLKIVYFWGQGCPNCVAAKKHLDQIAAELKALPIELYAVNAYEQMELTTRFGLFGIPVFLLFKRGRLIGRLPSFPGRDEFLTVIRRSV